MKKLLLVLVLLISPSLVQAHPFLDEQLVVVAKKSSIDRVLDVFIPSGRLVSDEPPYGEYAQFIEVAKSAYNSTQIEQKTIFGIPYFCISWIKFLSLINSLGFVTSTQRFLTLKIGNKNYTIPNLNNINSASIAVCNKFIGFPTESIATPVLPVEPVGPIQAEVGH